MKNNKNIVLDIDATLVHTHGDNDDFCDLDIYKKPKLLKLRRKIYTMKLYDVSGDSGSGNEIVLSGIYRPYLKEFLDFCHSYFNHVIIWSAGRKKYVEKMCEIMFPLPDKKPTIIYTYDDCDVGEEDYLKKPLEKLYKDKRLKGLNINQTNTLVLDDRDDTFSLNKKNGVMIPEFESDMTADEIEFHPDNCLIKFMCWLEDDKIKNCNDVRTLDKSGIFDKSLKYYKSKA